jgi:hypothetical protein
MIEQAQFINMKNMIVMWTKGMILEGHGFELWHAIESLIFLLFDSILRFSGLYENLIETLSSAI